LALKNQDYSLHPAKLTMELSPIQQYSVARETTALTSIIWFFSDEPLLMSRQRCLASFTNCISSIASTAQAQPTPDYAQQDLL
jgi:hypothetical protein